MADEVRFEERGPAGEVRGGCEELLAADNGRPRDTGVGDGGQPQAAASGQPSPTEGDDVRPPLNATEEQLVLRAEGLSYTYPHRANPVFRNMGLAVRRGEMLAILGNNGAGKSTVLDLVTGLVKLDMGDIFVDGRDMRTLKRCEIAQHVAYVAQRQSVPRLRVYDEVLLGRKPYIEWTVSDFDRQLVADTISRLGLEELSDRYCDELSGGERQKVFVARALVQQPDVLVLDEPTSALDPKNQVEVMGIVSEATQREQIATVLVLHDLNLALRFCNRFILLRDGEVLAQGGHEVITEESLGRTYGTAFRLIEADGLKVAVVR